MWAGGGLLLLLLLLLVVVVVVELPLCRCCLGLCCVLIAIEGG